MKITYFTVSRYRSITNAYRLDLKNVTILIGKNNEGKSNLINALNTAIKIIHYVGYRQQRILLSREYRWSEDFPLQLQNSKKLKNKSTDFRLDFSLNESEIISFKKEIGSTINGELSVYISIKQDGTLSFTIPKRGKNATALTNKYAKIAKFIYSNINIQFIPAIRSESDAYDVISSIVESELFSANDPEYKKAEEYIEQYQRTKLKELSNKIIIPLSRFMPSIKSIELSIEDRMRRRSFMYGKSVVVEMDDGVKTHLSQKGDGVKSLTTMAILSKTESKNRIIIVDEPENHLHPEAVRYLRQVLYELSENNQIIISTHNQIFVNRCNVGSNIIVNNNEAKPAKRIDEIRELLGVMISDNLIYSDYVIVVEGPTDKIFLTALIMNDNELSSLISNNYITIRSIGGVNNLKSELYNLERYMCNYIVILDNDEAGRSKAREVQDKLGIDRGRFRYFILEDMKDSELEDLFQYEVYQEFLRENYNIDITDGRFKNKSKKWTSRIKELAKLSGRILEDTDIDNIKKHIIKLVLQDNIYLTPQGQNLLQNILENIKCEVGKLS